ncbi:hypothetical protein KY289_019022 [Solanum tuberosum]|nr:hypothetical protein KY289_019022 [Solanum tuberosum]
MANTICALLRTSPKELLMHDPSLNQGGQMNSFTFAGNRGIMQNGTAKAVICKSKKLEDAVKEIGLQIKHYEDNIKFLEGQKNRLDDSILDIEVALGKIYSASGTGSENKESSNGKNELETIEEILTLNSCQLPTHNGTQITHIPYMKDVIGMVALLGKVDDDNINRTLSDYLGQETMLAVVCKTHDGLKALQTYDKKGFVNKSSGLHGVGASIGRPLDDRYLVICLENLRPYTGEFLADDPQRRLAIKKPRYLNEETPPGFLGFAVNMINIDTANLYCVTSTGHGLRETLFYRLFSQLQVYKTGADMMQALPFIADGAISLDGGIIKSGGIFSLGKSHSFWQQPRYHDCMGNLRSCIYTGLDSFHDLGYDKEVVMEKIEGKADSAAAVVHKLLRSPKPEQLYLKYAHDILGVVALLGEFRTHKLSSALDILASKLGISIKGQYKVSRPSHIREESAVISKENLLFHAQLYQMEKLSLAFLAMRTSSGDGLRETSFYCLLVICLERQFPLLPEKVERLKIIEDLKVELSQLHDQIQEEIRTRTKYKKTFAPFPGMYNSDILVCFF